MSSQGPSLCRHPPPHPSGDIRRFLLHPWALPFTWNGTQELLLHPWALSFTWNGTQEFLLHPWVLAPLGSGPAAPPRASQLLPAIFHLSPQEKGSMARSREGVIPA